MNWLMPKDKPHNGGQWTVAKFNSFIKGGLRSLSNRWGPKFACKKAAWVKRGVYRCAGYLCEPHLVPATLPPKPGNKKRIDNAVVDHVSPVVPVTGFTTWDVIIKNMFCEVGGLQVLCHECHSRKTQEEQNNRKKNNAG